jgi:long-chain acyl-CoA synthetase
VAGLRARRGEATERIENIYRDKGDTWPKILKYNAEKYGDKHIAMRYKHHGIWQTYSWQDYYLNVKYLALGLLSLGFQCGDKLLIIGDNEPQWYYGELAGQANNGVVVGLYSDLTPQEIKYLAANSEARFALAEDQEQLDKLLQIREDLPQLEKIIYWRYKGLSGYSDTRLIGYRQVRKLGEAYEAEHPGIFEQNIAAGKAGDVCAIVYTSGTTGDFPKGVIHTYSTLRPAVDFLLRLDPWQEDDNIAAYMPPAWITEQWFGIGCHLLSGGILNFAERPETQQKDIREIGPDILYNSARTWERQAVAIQARIGGADPLKRLIYRILMPVAYRMADARLNKKNPHLFDKILLPLVDLLVLRPLRDNLGLANARICYAFNAPLNPETTRFYYALKTPPRSLYSLTECGVVSCSCTGDIRLETVGTIPRGIELRITDKGELLCRQPGGFPGYYGDPEQTAAVLKDGWFYSGDSVRIDDEGHVVFIDRLRDIVKLDCGETLVPQLLESRLKSGPDIKDAWVLAGPDRAYASVIIIIDFENVGRWADRKKVAYTSFNDLSQKPEVYELIRRDIEKLNETLPPGCRIMKFANLHKEFDPDESELTRNRKLRKKFVEERYRELIEAIYGGKAEALIQIQIRYRDGRTGVIKTIVGIKSVGAAERPVEEVKE